MATIHQVSSFSSTISRKSNYFSACCFFVLSILVTTYNAESTDSSNFIRGQCPRPEDIHPCTCVLLPKHIDDEDNLRTRRMVRSTSNSQLAEKQDSLLPSESPPSLRAPILPLPSPSPASRAPLPSSNQYEPPLPSTLANDVIRSKDDTFPTTSPIKPVASQDQDQDQVQDLNNMTSSTTSSPSPYALSSDEEAELNLSTATSTPYETPDNTVKESESEETTTSAVSSPYFSPNVHVPNHDSNSEEDPQEATTSSSSSYESEEPDVETTTEFPVYKESPPMMYPLPAAPSSFFSLPSLSSSGDLDEPKMEKSGLQSQDYVTETIIQEITTTTPTTTTPTPSITSSTIQFNPFNKMDENIITTTTTTTQQTNEDGISRNEVPQDPSSTTRSYPITISPPFATTTNPTLDYPKSNNNEETMTTIRPGTGDNETRTQDELSSVASNGPIPVVAEPLVETTTMSPSFNPVVSILPTPDALKDSQSQPKGGSQVLYDIITKHHPRITPDKNLVPLSSRPMSHEDTLNKRVTGLHEYQSISSSTGPIHLPSPSPLLLPSSPPDVTQVTSPSSAAAGGASTFSPPLVSNNNETTVPYDTEPTSSPSPSFMSNESKMNLNVNHPNLTQEVKSPISTTLRPSSISSSSTHSPSPTPPIPSFKNESAREIPSANFDSTEGIRDESDFDDGSSDNQDHWSLWESMLVCRNIKSPRVMGETFKNMNGYHFDFVVIDSCRLPQPFPFSMFKKFSFDFLELLNMTSVQFSDNFSDRGREYYYGRSNKSGREGGRTP